MSIHTSPYPTLPIPSQSVYTFLFSSNRHPQSLAAFIDAPTGRTISRAELHSLTLSLAHGLRNVLPAGKTLFGRDVWNLTPRIQTDEYAVEIPS